MPASPPPPPLPSSSPTSPSHPDPDFAAAPSPASTPSASSPTLFAASTNHLARLSSPARPQSPLAAPPPRSPSPPRPPDPAPASSTITRDHHPLPPPQPSSSTPHTRRPSLRPVSLLSDPRLLFVTPTATSSPPQLRHQRATRAPVGLLSAPTLPSPDTSTISACTPSFLRPDDLSSHLRLSLLLPLSLCFSLSSLSLSDSLSLLLSVPLRRTHAVAVRARRSAVVRVVVQFV